MFLVKKTYIVLWLIFSLIAVLVACSPTVRYNVLNTIFDGVPTPESNESLTVGLDTLGQADSTRILALASASDIPRYDYHPPYREKDCASCHNQQRMGQLVAEEPELCYQCHDNKEEHPVKHGPAGAGFCTACHRPHKSREDNLLLEAGNALCFNCHETNLVADNIIHQEIKKKDNCVDCHNPHSSENNSMLQSGACYSCHEEKINDYSFLHGPVAANYCSTCHENHASKNEHLLVRAGNNLCLSCHDTTTLYLNQKHQENKQENCTNCHNPHGGEDEFMLN
jgi:predicted CXXCH cytochrome family protein